MSINSDITEIKENTDEISISLGSSIKNRILHLKYLSANPEELSEDELKEEIREQATLLKQEITAYRSQISTAKNIFLESKTELAVIKNTLTNAIEDASNSVLDYKNNMNNHITIFDNTLNNVRDEIANSTQESFS